MLWTPADVYVDPIRSDHDGRSVAVRLRERLLESPPWRNLERLPDTRDVLQQQDVGACRHGIGQRLGLKSAPPRFRTASLSIMPLVLCVADGHLVDTGSAVTA